MYPYIICFCGREIGHIFDAFNAMRQEKHKKAFADLGYNIDPRLLAITFDFKVDLSDIFDALGLHVECCRTRISTQAQFSEFY